MKKILTFLALMSSLCAVSQAQDIILKTDGSEIEAIVEEISETEVKYKLFSSPNGPTRVLSVNSIFRISYEDGSVELFSNADNQGQDNYVPDSYAYAPWKWSVWKGGFISGESLLSETDIRRELDNVQYQNYAKAYSIYNAGTWMASIGLAFVVCVPIINGITKAEASVIDVVLVATGGASVLIGIPLTIAGSSRLQKIAEEHNSSYVSTISLSPALIPLDNNYCQATGTGMVPGISLRINF